MSETNENKEQLAVGSESNGGLGARTLDDHLEDAERWREELSYGDPMQMTGWRPTVAVLADAVHRLHAALLRHGQHDEDCRSQEDGPDTCSCGFDVGRNLRGGSGWTSELQALQAERDRYRAVLDDIANSAEQDSAYLARIAEEALDA